jgi:uncharacterized protein YggE
VVLRTGAMVASAGAPVPIDAGEGTVVADVSVTWALGPAV